MTKDHQKDKSTPGGDDRDVAKLALRWAQILPDTPILQAGVASSSYAAEQYRQLAVRARPIDGPSRQVLTVTSAEPAAGKTVTALNLALAMARNGEQSVVLVECDLWKPTLQNYLRIDPSIPGLHQVFQGEAQVEDAIASVWGAGLDVIRAGTEGQMENQFADRRMAKVLTRLSARCETVILDGPPFLLASGRSVALMSDQVVVVVRSEHSKRQEIEEALSGLGRDSVLGFVLNDISPNRLPSALYGAYARYSDEGEGRPPGPTEVDGESSDAGVSELEWAPMPTGEAPQERDGSRWGMRWLLVIGALVVAAIFVLLWWWGRDSTSDSSSAEQQDPARVSAAAAVASEMVPLPVRATAPPRTGRTRSAARFRSGPGQENRVLLGLEAGEDVEILEGQGDPSGSWLRVRKSGIEGWISADLVEEDRGGTSGAELDRGPS